MATATKVSVNPTPKQRFLLSSDSVSKHKAMVDSNEFQRALDFALLHYTRFLADSSPSDLAGANQVQASAFAFQRLQGVNDFIATLKSLAEMPPAPAPKVSDNLS